MREGTKSASKKGPGGGGGGGGPNMLAFLVRRTENASRFGPPGPKCTRTDFTVTPAL